MVYWNIWLASLLFASAFRAFAAPSADYFVKILQSQDGLPQSAVSAIIQTRDGYLWLGTYSALARFDGVSFRVFDNSTTPELQNSRVTSLFESPDGALWIGHETGEVTRYKDGQFQAQVIHADWKGGKIHAIASDDASDIWIVNEESQMARLRDGLVLTPEPGPAGRLLSVARNPRGVIWIIRSGKVSALQHGKLTPVEFEGETPDTYVQGVCPSRSGGWWVASNGRLRRWVDGRWADDRGDAPWGVRQVLAMVESRNGCVVGGTVDSGLHLVFDRDEVLHFNHTNGLVQDWARTICEDHEGNLWVGVGSAGLAMLRAGKVATVKPPDRWRDHSLLSVSVDNDRTLWVGTEGAGIYRLRDQEWTHLGEAEGLGNQFVWSVSTDSRGQFWAGTWGGGLFILRNARFERVPGLEDFNTPTLAVLHGSNGVTWIGTTEGLLRYESGKTQWFGRKEGLDQADVRTIAPDPDGSIWFGMVGGGLGHLKNGQVRQFKKRDGLSSDSVQCLHLDPDGVLWIGTIGGGVNRLKNGRFFAITTGEGLQNNVICHITDDGAGFFWISSHGGIMRVSRADMERCADRLISSVNSMQYGIGEGLPTLECSGGLEAGGCRDAQGNLWFATGKGLVRIDPRNVKINQLRPPVVIEDLFVESKSFPLSTNNAPLRIPAGQQRFEIRYAGLSFTVPDKVRFKYQLEGSENDWTDAGTKRSVNYTHLPPGAYTFHVKACNNDGIWNDDGASLSFIVLPQFWQTWWFRTLAAVASAAVVANTVWYIARRRMRRKFEQLEQQRAIERERARIAKDIHDDLGASLTRITMLSQSVRGELEGSPEAAEDVDRIFSTARELTRAMEEIVWAVSPRHDTLDSLATYLGKFAQDFLAAAHIRCRLDVPVHLPAWPLTAETRHNLFLAFKEALNNAVKHSGTSEVRVSLVIEKHRFALVVEDEGRGFTSKNGASNGASGNGLPNMRQRLTEISGQFDIETIPNKGTRVTFLVPVKSSHN